MIRDFPLTDMCSFDTPDCFNCPYPDCTATSHDIQRQWKNKAVKALDNIDRIPERVGSHAVPITLDISPSHKDCQQRYEQTDKGRARKERYRLSDKGKQANRRYDRSEKGKERFRRYYLKKKKRTI